MYTVYTVHIVCAFGRLICALLVSIDSSGVTFFLLERQTGIKS